jgi:phenylalanyl-tRNA synthetase beta chain
VQREADLIEEVARVHGLDKLPTTLPARRAAVGRLTGNQPLRRRLEDVLRDRGLHETISYSFTAPEALARLRLGDEEPLRILNPLSEELSMLRPRLLPGLLDAARHNAVHGRAGVALFESAHVYKRSRPLDDVPEGSPHGTRPAEEQHRLAVLVTEAAPGGWRSPRVPGDFFATRALLEAVMAAARVGWRAQPGGPPFLHPGRSATVCAGDQDLGWVGELHPLVLREWELEGPATAFELNIDRLAAAEAATYSEVTSFPAVLQDIAVVVADEVSAAEVERAVRAGGGELLAGVRVFDLYRGEQVGEGNKSLALRLEFRASDRTLTDDEVAERRAAIEGELGEIGGSLRA